MRRRLQDMEEGVTGDERIPYDRTDPMVDVPAPAGPQVEDLGQEAAPTALLSQVGAEGLPADDSTGMTTDSLSDVDLASMANEGLSLGDDISDESDLEAAQLEALLLDPNVSPEEKAQVQAALALAARRRLAGLGESAI